MGYDAMAAASREDSRKAASRITLLALIAVLGLLLTGAYQIKRMHDAAWVEAETEARRAAALLRAHLDRTLERLDQHLVAVTRQVASPQLSHLMPAERRDAIFGAVQQSEVTLVTDATGAVVLDSASAMPRVASLAARDFFGFHQERPGAGLHVTAPYASQPSGRVILAVTRRRDSAEGGFAGIVGTMIDVAPLRAAFDNARIGRRGSISLIRDDGVLLLRTPPRTGVEGSNLADTPVFRAMRESRNESFAGRASLDGEERLYVPERLPRAGLNIIVAVSNADVRAGWLGTASVLGGILLLLAGGLMAAVALFRRELSLRQGLILSLNEREAQFRALAEGTADLVCRIGPGGYITYASPVARDLLGRTPESLLGKRLEDLSDAEGEAAVTLVAAMLLDGRHDRASAEFRAVHADGSRLWLEASLGAARHPETGQPDGFVAVLRDVMPRGTEPGFVGAQDTPGVDAGLSVHHAGLRPERVPA